MLHTPSIPSYPEYDSMRFDDKADLYHENAFIQRDLVSWGKLYFEKLEWTGKRVLEFGAGTGVLTEELVGFEPEYLHATDNSQSMLARGEVKVPKITWSFQDAWEPTLKGYDLITSSSLLHWAEDPVAVLRKWRGVLNEKGEVRVLFYITGTLREFEYPTPIKWRDEEFWVKSFDQAGYEVVKSKSELKQYKFRNTLELLRFLHKTGTTEKNTLTPTELLSICRDDRMKQEHISSWNFCMIHGRLR